VSARRSRHTRARVPTAPAEVALSVILDIIVPIFGVMAFGYGATFTRVFDEAAAGALAAFVF
jgi:hypothetical protein